MIFEKRNFYFITFLFIFPNYNNTIKLTIFLGDLSIELSSRIASFSSNNSDIIISSESY